MGYKNTKKVQYLVLVDKIKKSSKNAWRNSTVMIIWYALHMRNSFLKEKWQES